MESEWPSFVKDVISLFPEKNYWVPHEFNRRRGNLGTLLRITLERITIWWEGQTHLELKKSRNISQNDLSHARVRGRGENQIRLRPQIRKWRCPHSFCGSRSHSTQIFPSRQIVLAQQARLRLVLLVAECPHVFYALFCNLDQFIIVGASRARSSCNCTSFTYVVAIRWRLQASLCVLPLDLH